MKRLQYRIEAAALSFLFAGFRLLPMDVSSAIGGWMGRALGPFFSAHRTAKKNLAMAFPDLKKHEVSRLAMRAWEHFGRVGAEYALLHDKRLLARAEISGLENLPLGKAAFFFSGHIGNWEVMALAAHAHGADLTVVYRHTNNPYVDSIIADMRASHASELVRKGTRGAMQILSALKRKSIVTMLVDQKQNNGIAVPFFGRDAMTSPAIAEIALKYDIPIIPALMVRTKGVHFKGTVYPPLTVQKTGDHKKDVLTLMTQINAVLEGWIREYPEQWFWMHRRWPKE